MCVNYASCTLIFFLFKTSAMFFTKIGWVSRKFRPRKRRPHTARKLRPRKLTPLENSYPSKTQTTKSQTPGKLTSPIVMRPRNALLVTEMAFKLASNFTKKYLWKTFEYSQIGKNRINMNDFPVRYIIIPNEVVQLTAVQIKMIYLILLSTSTSRTSPLEPLCRK